jgi:ABC-type dipeptide/oligopeptide/nickel transport system permease component
VYFRDKKVVGVFVRFRAPSQAKYHLDLPLWQQYLYYLKSLFAG